MQDEYSISHRSPFDHGLFFPDSGRSSTLEALRNAVAGSASLITCIGDEGHGKTMLCKILEKEAHDPYLVISFPYSVESFDYVLQIIALKLNLDFSMEDNAVGTVHILTEITRVLREQGKRLLILFDEAEKLYLATLERVRKMIDLTNEEGVLLQIILFGRMGLQAHIEQLALCTFKDAKEVHLFLPPLTEEDTFHYLNFCMQQRPGSEKKDIFSREVAAKILAMSHGNFRKINSLAGDSLRSSAYGSDNTSFMVLLEHVRDSGDLASGEPPAPRLPLVLRQNKIALGAAIFLVAALLFLSLSREAKQGATPSSTPEGQSINPAKTAQTVADGKARGTETVPTAPLASKQPRVTPMQPAPAAVDVPVVSPTPPAPPVTENPVVLSAPPIPSAAAGQVEKPVSSAPPAAKEAVADSIPEVPAVAKKPVTPPISVEIAPLVEKRHSAVQVVIADKVPKKNTIIPLLTPEPVTRHKELLKIKKASKSNVTAQLPQKSFAAGERWLAGQRNDRYTLQLMVLAADQAKEKLRGILSDEANQQGSENFIILKKTTSPATFLLFYGEYPTLAAARNARNDLPQSLQKYTPYPVSVKQAVEKSKQ